MSPQAINPLLAERVETTADNLILVLPEGKAAIPCEVCSPKLAAATKEERRQAELSPGGYGVHWPLIDEDLSVGGLVRDHAKGH